MTKLEKRLNVTAVFLPFAAFLAAIVLLWNSAVSATSLAILGVMYVLTGVGVTVGFHRLLTHRSFQVPKPLEYTFAVLGSMAVQGPVMAWVADHRKHHAHADEEGDPHSPHVGHGDGADGRNARPLARAHGLAVLDPGAGQRSPLREGPLRGSGHAAHQPALSVAGAAESRPAGAGRLGHHRDARRAPPAACSGAGSCASSSCTTSRGA